MPTLVSLADLERLMRDAFANSKVAPDTAAIVAAALAKAEADGISSHGAARVPAYAEQALHGKADGFAVPTIERTAAATLRVDARTGFAFPAIRKGLDAAYDIIGETGIVALGIANSHHFGVAGHPVEEAAERGLMAIAFSNTPHAIAPWGGKIGLFGTNPVAYACPRPGKPPLVMDLSLSVAARGKVVLAAKEGKPIPEGWALDSDGNPTTDSKAALDGTMLPIGGPKGAALALMVELLCGALTGSHFGYEGTSFFEPTGAPPKVGHLILLIDPRRFGGGDTAARTEAMLQAILGQPGTRLPGERRLALRAKAQAEGVTLPDALHAEIARRAANNPA
ncbi:Ldh family oxidoreductase [Oceanibaculum pacificum]|uniref:Sulfolactate dehydrogenase n=1 Tax=Oceanibaculum pacificum TaxID=580166 RepID=A0A154WEW8_9PROT|nr:Ldh family oxidoreductase [Oceanibaculum pacificum]KZD12036.1 sulfolactate dehydrogenase [Oceanibaculum pacificum]